MMSLERFSRENLFNDLMQNKNSFSSNIKKFITTDPILDLGSLGQAISDASPLNNKTLESYLEILYIKCLESAEEITEEFHQYYSYIVSKIHAIGAIDKDDLLNRVGNSSLFRALKVPIRIDNLIKEFKFLSLLKNSNLNVSAQISSIEALVKTNILASIANLENLEAGLAKVERAYACGMQLTATKQLLLTLIAGYIDSIPPNKLSQLKLRFLAIKTDYKGELDPPASASRPNEVQSGLNKINAVYLNNEEDPCISVWECTKPGISGRIALKELKTYDPKKLEPYKNEADILKRLSDTNQNFFVKFYSTSLREEKIGNRVQYILSIEMEYVSKSLKKHKDDRKSSSTGYSEAEMLEIFWQLILGFNTLVQLKILHNDIKPSNLMINDDFKIKVIDFNIAKELRNTTVFGNAEGTRGFMAPEVREAYEKNVKCNFRRDKSDVFSLGLTILYLMIDDPFEELNLEKNKKKLAAYIDQIKFEWLKRSLKKMLEFNPNDRCSLSELLPNMELPTDFK